MNNSLFYKLHEFYTANNYAVIHYCNTLLTILKKQVGKLVAKFRHNDPAALRRDNKQQRIIITKIKIVSRYRDSLNICLKRHNQVKIIKKSVF